MTSDVFERWAKETPKIRENIVKMIHQCKSGHPGGSLSMVEIIYALLARDGVMDHDPSLTGSGDKDRLVLSKGHGVPALYAIMSAVGYDITEEELMTLRNIGSRLQGHPDRARIPYLEASTGSLGQGASFAQGIALGYKLDNNPHHVYCILGDGETQEGQVWEVALSASHYKLNNLTLVIDCNKAQIDGFTKDVMNLEPLADKWRAFGWNVSEIDGHNYQQIVDAYNNISSDKPSMIVANTVKGKGVSFMEGQVGWHGKGPSDSELEAALSDINSNFEIGMMRNI